MIDGIPQSSPLRNNDREIRSIDPSVLERIEVVKGATSIYGNGAEGGIINYITQKDNSKNQYPEKLPWDLQGMNYLITKCLNLKEELGIECHKAFMESWVNLIIW
jgi:iron complex outermembrane receptor protein